LIDVALLVTDRLSTDLLIGTVLERGADGAYERTPHQMRAQLFPETSMVMGRLDDVAPGVPIQVRGRMASDGANAAYADQVAVLTGLIYVKRYAPEES
jgi:hypothetical protein